MNAFLSQLFSDKTGQADEMAALSILGVAVYLGLAIYAVVQKGQAFDPQAFGIGLGAVIGAAATGMGFKARSERNGDK